MANAANNAATIETAVPVGTVKLTFWEKVKIFLQKLELTHRALTTVMGVAVIALMLIAIITASGLVRVGHVVDAHSVQIAKANAEIAAMQAYLARPWWYRVTHKYSPAGN